ncbi:hypothetical protein L3X38_012767 [Prunus dulcis]|uniref:Retrotransposon Copia-like N-terminal domain-containing protein n=1 Tax=Prunus dulcis TaxID=3755 RepID=A0AAD4ZGC8_PRUDU|nr:hypothetical protein L3X38_012767 [Prunus dulcis]
MGDQDLPIRSHKGSSIDSSTTFHMILEARISKMTQLLNHAQTQIPTQTITYESSTAQIGIKLDGTNYAIWSQVVEMHISGKDKL